MSTEPTGKRLPGFEQRLLEHVLETYEPQTSPAVPARSSHEEGRRRRSWRRPGAVVIAVALVGTAGAVAATRTISPVPKVAVSTSGPGDVPLKRAPAGTPEPTRTFSALSDAPLATGDRARRFTESLSGEHLDPPRLLRSSQAGDLVYLAAGGGRVCLAIRRADHSGGEGCTPSNSAEDPATPLVLSSETQGGTQIAALVTDQAVEGTITTSEGDTNVAAKTNLIDALVRGVPETLTVRYHDGTTETTSLTDYDHNEQR